MGELNYNVNRVVWCDVPVADLDRAIGFYSAVLGSEVSKQAVDGFEFAVLDHEGGNGGCLIPSEGDVNGTGGLLVYFNVNGRIRDAVGQVLSHGGKVVQHVHSIGQHGVRAIATDSEGNRIALHSTTDA